MPETALLDDFDTYYRAVASRDTRFDGRFFTGVTTTGVYCRPICPARTPKPENVRFFRVAAAAEAAGFRTCRRCRPDKVPGSPDWNIRADLAGRALRLIADGAADQQDGVAALARTLAVSERHLHRVLVAELGVGPLTLARSRRAQTARLLLESTALPVSDVAFAAGYGSIRQFNDSVREAFGATPSEIRVRFGSGAAAAELAGSAVEGDGALTLRLTYRTPFDFAALLGWFGDRAIPGVDEVVGTGRDLVYRRALRLPHGTGQVELRDDKGVVHARLVVDDLRDVAVAVRRCRDLLDLDADPAQVDAVLAGDPALAPLVAARPGLRVPGAVDGFEIAVRAVLGQQISVAAARTMTARLVQRFSASSWRRKRHWCRTRPFQRCPLRSAARRQLRRRWQQRLVRRATRIRTRTRKPPRQVTLSTRKRTSSPSRAPRPWPPATTKDSVSPAAPWRPCARWPPPSRVATSPWTAASTGPRRGRSCWPCPVSVRGPPTMSRCACSATPMPSPSAT